MKKAKFVTEITVVDPDTNAPVEIAVYKHENGGIFAIDSSYIEQVLNEDEPVPDVFNEGMVELTEEVEENTSEAKFFLASLVEIKGNVLDFVYPELVKRNLVPTIEERLGSKEGKCEECGKNKWWLMPKEVHIVRGEKQYIECLKCGHTTHL